MSKLSDKEKERIRKFYKNNPDLTKKDIYKLFNTTPYMLKKVLNDKGITCIQIKEDFNKTFRKGKK